MTAAPDGSFVLVVAADNERKPSGMPRRKWVTEGQTTTAFSVVVGGESVGMCTGILLEEVEEHRELTGPITARRRWRILDIKGPSLHHVTAPQPDALLVVDLADGRSGSVMMRGTTMTGSGPLA